MSDDKALGKYIRRVRKHRKLKGTDLARAIGKSPAYVCDLEKGRRGVTAETAVMISDYLQIPLNSILSKHPQLAPISNTDKMNQVYRALRHKGRARRIFIALESMDKTMESLKTDAKPGHVPPRVESAIFQLAGLLKDLQTALTVG